MSLCTDGCLELLTTPLPPSMNTFIIAHGFLYVLHNFWTQLGNQTSEFFRFDWSLLSENVDPTFYYPKLSVRHFWVDKVSDRHISYVIGSVRHFQCSKVSKRHFSYPKVSIRHFLPSIRHFAICKMSIRHFTHFYCYNHPLSHS